MARRPHAHLGERKESSKARQAWIDYRDMPVGQRSLANLVARYRTTTESPPTRSLERLKCWSQVFCWQARLAAHEAEIDFARRQEQVRQVEAQVRENSKLMQLCSAALSIGESSGKRRRIGTSLSCKPVGACSSLAGWSP
jgi:hypothetical protein